MKGITEPYLARYKLEFSGNKNSRKYTKSKARLFGNLLALETYGKYTSFYDKHRVVIHLCSYDRV
jgi:hypothetical protein